MFGGPVHDYWEPPRSAAAESLIAGVVGAQRAENRAAARRLRLVARLFEVRRAQRGECAEWAVDTWAAVGAEIAAALGISVGRAGSAMSDGLAMAGLPAVAGVFEAGEIDLATYRTIVFRTALITDGPARAAVDGRLAAAARRWPSMSAGRLAREVDAVIAGVDPDAVRREQERARDREVRIWPAQDGSADVSARLLAADAEALDARLDALAATVCPADPRTTAQRRADALGALAGGADRLRCRCGSAECPAAGAVAAPVVVHVIAEGATLAGRSSTPAYLLGSAALISATALRELAADSRVRPLADPGAAEPRYRPSAALADFVRARDLTCRAPGCDRPATDCDLDHTVPYAAGGATHATNIKCLCRFHHLLKTFWGWNDRQLPDGTIIWTLPDNQTHTTTPAGTALFPTLHTPTPPNNPEPPGSPAPRPTDTPDANRTAMMPRRRTTRAHNRAHHITTERNRNHRERTRNRREYTPTHTGPPPKPGDDDPPPF